MEDAAWDELKQLRSENKRLIRLTKPFIAIGKLLSEYEDSNENFNSSYFTEIYCKEYDFTVDGPALEDYIRLYKDTQD